MQTFLPLINLVFEFNEINSLSLVFWVKKENDNNDIKELLFIHSYNLCR